MTDNLWKKSRELVAQIRTEWLKLDVQRDIGIQQPEDILVFENLAYGPHGEDNYTDIYCKKEEDTLLPVIVSVHGGGWVYSNKELYKCYCQSLAHRGFAVVNFNYRLAPEHPFPAAMEDVNQLFCWLMEHGSTYGLDMEKIFVVGDSVGAQMAAQYLAIVTNPSYADCFSFHCPSGLNVLGAALNCGIYDMEYSEEMMNLLEYAYFDGHPERYQKQNDILGNITENFVPTFVMTSYHDFLKECSMPLYQALKEKKVTCVYKLYGAEDRPEVEHVFHCDLKLPEAAVCNDEECEFFRSLL